MSKLDDLWSAWLEGKVLIPSLSALCLAYTYVPYWKGQPHFSHTQRTVKSHVSKDGQFCYLLVSCSGKFMKIWFEVKGASALCVGAWMSGDGASVSSVL